LQKLSQDCYLLKKTRKQLKKLLCDEMLSKLGKWLRAAGYDTLIANSSMSDQELLDLAVAQDRILLTRDSHFAERRIPLNRVLYLQSNSVEDCVKELRGLLEIDWLVQPFSRCMICNTAFTAPQDEALKKLPEDVRSQHKKVWYCEKCKKAYWEGSHTGHMLQQLKQWQSDSNL
jgi:uncharacterized protein